MKHLAALAVAATLGACAFWSDRALFAADPALPIADGAQFTWIEDGDARERVAYRRLGAGYELAALGDDDQPLHVQFYAVTETPEEDYVAQVAARRDEPERFYAFMWRIADGYRVVAAPRVLEEDARGQGVLARRCSARPSGECRFDRAEDVLALYRDAVYPAFVVAGAVPSDYIDQIEISSESRAK